jgi:hypothetical protein
MECDQDVLFNTRCHEYQRKQSCIDDMAAWYNSGVHVTSLMARRHYWLTAVGAAGRRSGAYRYEQPDAQSTVGDSIDKGHR